jgi:hypothetical protein
MASLQHRIQINVRAHLASNVAENWFKIMVVMLSLLLTASAVGLAIFGSTSGAYTGLLLSYIVNLNQCIEGYIMVSTYVENGMVSF